LGERRKKKKREKGREIKTRQTMEEESGMKYDRKEIMEYGWGNRMIEDG
jgi:hypothetical protein